MNSLSWMLYGAEVIGNVQGLLIGLTVLGSGFVGICGIIFLVSEGEEDTRPLVKRWLWAPVFTATLATLIPSSGTVYLIAASQAGEQIVTSPDAVEMLGDLKGIIKQRLEQELGTGAGK